MMRWWLVSILVFYISYSNAQLPVDIKFTNYTRSSGLPEENVNNIVQDSRGFLWMGSREGLIRFDGLHYKTWYANPNDSTKFSNNNIYILGENLPGNILFLSGTDIWGLNIYNHQFSEANYFKGKIIIAQPQKITNNHWCVTDFDSLYITDASLNLLFSLSHKNYFGSNTVLAAFPLHHPYSLIYTSTDSKLLLLNIEKRTLTPVQLDNKSLESRSKYYTPTAYDSVRKRLYLSAYFNGNYYVDLQLPETTSYKPEKMSFLSDGAIRSTILLSGNRLMQGGDNGLYITDFKTTASFNSRSKLDKPMISSIVLNIYAARDGSYWLSTTNGITRFSLNNPQVNYWRKELNVGNGDEFKSILKGADRNIYYLAQDKSLFRFNRSTGTTRRVDSSLYYCWSATQSGDDIIFTGAGRKIAVYNTLSGKISHPSFLQPFYTNNTDLVTLVFKSRNGDLWYSCNGSAGIIRNPYGTNELIQYSRTTSPPAFSHSYVHTAAEDSKGNIWWASNKTSMLLKWNASKKQFEEYPVDQLIPQHKLKTGVSGLFIDAAENLWVALDGAGLMKYNLITKSGAYYDINKGLPADAVYGMCNDSKNRLWFGTRKGLCCYLPDKDKVIAFTSYDGFPEDDFEGNGIYYDKEENLLYLGAKQSIAFFNPDTLLQRTITRRPPVFIDEMLVNGRVFYFDNEKKIKLGTKENNIEFSFASPDFNRNNQLTFQYQLIGSSNEWVDLGDKRSVTFNGLPHGKYTISVRCKYKGTETWEEASNPFTFTIKTPLTKTLWFRLLVVAFIAGFVWAIIRNYYLRKLEKQRAYAERIQAVEKERTRIATDMHDDFGASLSRIKFLSEKLQLYNPDNPSEKNDLEKISLYSDEMAEKMNEIVWALNQRYDSLGDLVSFCRSYISEYLQDKDIKLHFQTGDIQEKKIQGEVRRNIFLVIKEALHNIVKHAKATEVTISFSQDDQLHVIIHDNGKGIEKDNIRPFANGLENMKKRIEDINGRFSIENKGGTRITLSIPV